MECLIDMHLIRNETLINKIMKTLKNIKTTLLLLLLGMGTMLSAQTGGTIKGQVYSADSTEAIPFAIVRMEVAGEIVSTKADFDGKYSFYAISAGKYNLSVETTLNGKTTINGVVVSSDQIAEVNIYMTSGVIGEEVVITWHPPKIDINNVTKISSAELKHNINIQNPNQMLATKSSEITLTENNELIIRGSRPGDVVYYIDGVKQTSMNGVPGIAIGGMTVYTGGIPAKYGDTTGGVVILETKGYFDLYYAWLANQ